MWPASMGWRECRRGGALSSERRGRAWEGGGWEWGAAGFGQIARRPRKGEGEEGWRGPNGKRRWKLKNRCGWDRNRNLEMRRLNGE